MDTVAIDHRGSRAGRWLRERRLRIALWIAIVEGLLVILDVIPGWAALLAGAAIVAFYFFVGRNLRAYTVRQASWVAAASQVLVASIPVLLAFVGLLAIVALALLAAAAFAFLLADRR